MAIEIGSPTDSKEAVSKVNALANNEEVVDQTDETEESDETTETADDAADETQVDESTDDESVDEEIEAESTDEIADDVKPKKKGGFQKKLEKKDKEIADIRAENARLKALAESKADPKPDAAAEKEVVSTTLKKPEQKDFETVSEFNEAIMDWKIAVKDEAVKIDNAKVAAKNEQIKIADGFKAKCGEFQKANPDFKKNIKAVDDITMSEGLHDAIITSDLGPQILNDLAKNRAEYERINVLSPFLQAKEIGKLEARISAKAAEPKKQSKTPAPEAPLGTKNGSSVPTDINSAKSFKEYEAVRLKQIAEKRKRG